MHARRAASSFPWMRHLHETHGSGGEGRVSGGLSSSSLARLRRQPSTRSLRRQPVQEVELLGLVPHPATSFVTFPTASPSAQSREIVAWWTL